MRKLLKISLIVFGLVFSLMAESSDIDRDLGWHLRFGQDAWNGSFQYLDTYTWTHYLQPWTNHEWGTDILYWPIFKYIGYLPIMFFYSLIAWLAFIFINKIYSPRLTISGLLFSLVAIFSVSPILIPHPATFLLPPLVIILWTLERAPEKRLFYLWPPVIWLWSILHGSWIFGFIFISIFVFGQIMQIIINSMNFRVNSGFLSCNKLWGIISKTCPAQPAGGDGLKKYFNWQENKTWQWGDIKHAIVWQALSFIILVINPYGTKIWIEVMQYFTKNYFKLYINEWLPSYTFPVFWLPLVVATVGGVLIIYAWRKKYANLSEVLVYAAFFYAAWKYKRNMVLPVLISVPLFTLAFESFKKEIKEKTKILSFFSQRNLKVGQICFLLGILALCANYFFRINWENHPWENKQLMFYQIQFPYEAAKVLKKEIGDKKIAIFNEFSWGAYLNWNVPNALVFLDGRGTATWMWSGGITSLEKYRMLKLEKDGLKELEKLSAQYILLKSEKVSSYTRPDFVNRRLFSNDKLSEILFADPSVLEIDLRASDNWTLIHSDYLSNLWKRVNQ